MNYNTNIKLHHNAFLNSAVEQYGGTLYIDSTNSIELLYSTFNQSSS